MLDTPLQMILVVLAGWINRQQLAIIDYLKEENRVLRELHGRRRLRFTDDQRRRSKNTSSTTIWNGIIRAWRISSSLQAPLIQSEPMARFAADSGSAAC